MALEWEPTDDEHQAGVDYWFLRAWEEDDLDCQWDIFCNDSSVACGSEASIFEACRAAEAALRDLLRPAVEALGGTLPGGEEAKPCEQ